MNDKILIIDDSEDDRLLYRRTLQQNAQSHYNFIEAGEGEEGLALIEREEPACVLLDYSLPGHNGIEVLKNLRARHPFTPVVMLTGQGNENVAVAAMQEGAQNYIGKSGITPESLDLAIRMAIEHCSMQKRIDDQRKALEIFTRALAHDLNEPVRTIRSFIDLLSQHNFPDKTSKYFGYIKNAADRMHMLINTVYLYTRLDDPMQMLREDCDMNAAFKGATENIAILISERRATVTSAPLPHVLASPVQIMQLLQNLICNAIHHSENPVTIRIAAEQKDDYWLFSVKDTGPGIDPSYLQKIFEPFKRMVRHEEQGAGLGLAICKKIVEAYGGKIWCESKLGEGADFRFTLPREESETSVTSSSASGKQGGDKLANLLLVDDSKAFIEIAEFELLERSQMQCNFFIARDGEEALTRLLQKQDKIDLMLLDINMPEMDGFDVLEQMRKQEGLKDIPVVMLTGSLYDKDMSRAKELGAVGYLTKPIDFGQLKSIIDTAPAIHLQQKNDGYALLKAA